MLIKSSTDIYSYTYALTEYFGLCFIKMASYCTYLSSNCFSYSVIPYRNLFKSIGGELMKFFIGCLIFQAQLYLPCHPITSTSWFCHSSSVLTEPWNAACCITTPRLGAASSLCPSSRSQESSAACSPGQQATGAGGVCVSRGRTVRGQFMQGLWSLALIPECRRLLEGLKLGNDLC